MIIREINASDTEAFLNLTAEVERTSDFMLWEEGERTITAADQRNRIEAMKQSENSTILLAEVNNKLAGYVMAFGGNAKRNKHSAYLVAGVLKEYRGIGIGTELFKEMEKWAVDHGIHRLELTAVTQNEAGVALYKKIGFEIEGTKRDSLFIGGRYVDEYYMGKLIFPDD
ncbi:GNAT family N-acetyltransferase [Bacillus marinisedimentorum]|uniref:GNAT family N-acetyltransferase n=1 Tax=Bacillus marinisedimentorum TaxID=1821260 RepID=UPI0007DF5FC7|nr:GNAT family N-acetyltransferase [Bacillus marinisedimentorum]